jgi:hypothetical protein
MEVNDIEEYSWEHVEDGYCNCEICFYARGSKEVCATCGCIVGEGCNHEN